MKRHQLRALQIVSVIATLLVFVYFVPWLTAHGLEDLLLYSNPPLPPENAKAFSVNHGTFTYYVDSPRSSPLKAASIIAFLLANCGFQVWLKLSSKS